MAKQDNEVSGLEKLGQGSLFYIIAAILEIIGFALIVTLVGAVAGITMLIISAIIFIFWILRTEEGFRTLSNLGKDVRSGVTATILILVGILIEIAGLLGFFSYIAASLSAISASNINGGISGLLSGAIFAGIVILIIGAIISLVGNIILGLAYIRTGDIYYNNNLRSGGLLIIFGNILYIIPFLDIIFYIISFYILGAVGSTANSISISLFYYTLLGAILVFIGYILVYSGLGSVIITMLSKAISQPYMQQSTSSTQLPPQPSAPLSQIGTGKLSSNGIAEVTIYSQGAVQILSAAILGTNNISSDIFPAQLNSGYNNVKINF
ncbi:MAG: DUF973 family protein, partial [Saccharolobus sp.]